MKYSHSTVYKTIGEREARLLCLQSTELPQSAAGNDDGKKAEKKAFEIFAKSENTDQLNKNAMKAVETEKGQAANFLLAAVAILVSFLKRGGKTEPEHIKQSLTAAAGLPSISAKPRPVSVTATALFDDVKTLPAK